MRVWSKKGSRSPAPSRAPAVSISVAGTQEGRANRQSMGWPSADRSMYSMPAAPSTLAISWGSATTVVVPQGATARANSLMQAMELSMCTWASMNPGAR
jgi:hypothetical protein